MSSRGLGSFMTKMFNGKGIPMKDCGSHHNCIALWIRSSINSRTLKVLIQK
jgi:hypothetical protein